MADKSDRWERLTEKPAEKPAFSARQSTESMREPVAERPHRRSRRHSRGRSSKTWYMIGVGLLIVLAAILAWQLFAT